MTLIIYLWIYRWLFEFTIPETAVFRRNGHTGFKGTVSRLRINNDGGYAEGFNSSVCTLLIAWPNIENESGIWLLTVCGHWY